MFYINTIGRCVLADDEQFLRPGRDELFGLAQHRVDAAADQLSAQVGDDAESAAMVAALAALEIAIVPGGEFQTTLGDEVDEGALCRRRGGVEGEIGRASGRERGGQYVERWVGAG